MSIHVFSKSASIKKEHSFNFEESSGNFEVFYHTEKFILRQNIRSYRDMAVRGPAVIEIKGQPRGQPNSCSPAKVTPSSHKPGVYKLGFYSGRKKGWRSQARHGLQGPRALAPPGPFHFLGPRQQGRTRN